MVDNTARDLSLELLAPGSWGWLTVDDDWQILACHKLAGLPEIPVGGRLLEFFIDEDRRALAASLGTARKVPLTAGVLHSQYGALVRYLLVDRGGKFDFFYLLLDRQVRALERLAVFYRHFLSTQISICITDPQGEILDVNPSFMRLYDYTLEDLRGGNPRLLKSGRQSPDAYREMWRQITDDKIGSWTGEIINRKRSGEEVTVLITISAARQSDGQLLGYVASTIDITRQKELEAELRAKNHELIELNQFKSELMAITSHDLKSPLGGMISRAQLLRDELAALPQQQIIDHLEQIIESGGKLTGFINDLLDLEKIESGKFQLNTRRVRLDSVLRNCIEINAQTAGRRRINIDLRLVGEPQPVRADVLKLEQVFNNLLGNAVKFSPDEGRIEVVLHNGGPGESKRIDICDQGPGVPAEDLDRIFDRFYQVEKKGFVPKRAFGAGLGLSIVQNIIGLHSGRVSAANRPEGGCIFTVELPDLRAIHSSRDIAALIVDAQENIFRYLEVPLRTLGIPYFIVKNLSEARRVYAHERPEVIFASEVSITGELVDFLSKLRFENNPRPLRVLIGTGEEVSTEIYDQIITLPLLDMEIYSLLQEELNHSFGVESE